MYEYKSGGFVLSTLANLRDKMVKYMSIGYGGTKRRGKKKVHKFPRISRARLGYQRSRSYRGHPKTELKCFDVSATSDSFRTAALAGTFLNLPVVGTDVFNRIGRKIYMKSIHIKGFVNQIATAVQSIGRMFLIYDSQTNGSAIALSDVIQDSNPAATTTGLSHININNRSRFRVLRDKEVILPAATFNAGVITNPEPNMDACYSSWLVDWFVPLGNLETEYNAANAGAGTDVTSGALFVMFTTQNSDQSYQFTFTSRLRFYD